VVDGGGQSNMAALVWLWIRRIGGRGECEVVSLRNLTGF
jgi:hypothetical protein